MTLEYMLNRLTEVSYSYHMLVMEPEETEIFLDDKAKVSVGSMKDYNNKIVKVIAQKKVNNKQTVLFEVKGELAGWFQPTTSVMLHHKKFEHVIVDYERFKSPEINTLMGNRADLSHAFKSYNIVSKYFAIHNGQQIEAIYTGNRFLGFAPSEVLARSVKLKGKKAMLGLGLYSVYTTPSKTTIVHTTFDSEAPVQVIDSYPRLKMCKIQQGALIGWVDQAALPQFVMPEDRADPSMEEMLFEHLIQTFMSERTNHKTVTKKLLNESMTLRTRLVKMDKASARTEQFYSNLRKSKLGRIQVAIWERKSRGGRRK